MTRRQNYRKKGERHTKEKKLRIALDSQLSASRNSISEPVNQVDYLSSTTSNKGKQQIEYYSTYEVAKCSEIVEKSITERTSNWTAKIILNDKSIPHQSRAGNKAYQNLVFSDSEGTRVRATIFDSNIDLLENTLTILKSYYVSNISVRPSNPRYKFENTKYQWFINSHSIMEEVMKEDEDLMSSNIYNFTPLSDVQKHDLEAEIDILAVVLDILPPKKVKSETLPLQQIVLADSDLTTINLSMWSNFMAKEIDTLSTMLDTMPIILVTRTKISYYNGIVSLNTRHSSTLIINPDIPIATTLHTWCSNHEAKLIELRKNMSQASIPTTSATTTTNIEDILNSKTLNVIHHVRASISVDNLQQKFWYMGCS
eukprot:TRINITY_DN34342_c0_g1_i1.p1 TRINITY_DN34342_c0_g1~~TRINITY_DN34342_c0_g1_i1.p1  ORF type:complete len:370 (-),score=42.64 TRINITY_DN34342_c0_g1_i1:313-1422(-)